MVQKADHDGQGGGAVAAQRTIEGKRERVGACTRTTGGKVSKLTTQGRR